MIGAEVYTVDTNEPWAAAFSYDTDGVITAVGSTEMVMAAAGANPTVIDASGSMIVPGFQDTHVHVLEAGINADLCFIPASQSLEQYEVLAGECADQQPDAEWVLAAGPSLFELRDTNELPIEALDRAIPDRPALILDDLGHAVWTNTLGLEAAGIGPDDPDPQGGVLHRDVDTGRLTGLVLENAQQLIRNAAAVDDESAYTGLLRALDELTRNGVTSVSDAGGFWAQNHPAAWQRALDDGVLTVRAANSLYVYPDLDVELQLAEFERRFSDDSDLLRFDTAKIYVDGILDLGTAALLEPYEVPIDPLYPSGLNYFTPEQLRTYVNELHALGYRLSFHVIGDAAVRSALDAVESINDTPDAIADRRHLATHTYMVDDDDLDRFAEIGVVADFQQSPDAIDAGYHEYLSDFIGDRAFDLIPAAKVLETGADVALSSDWDAGPLAPLGTIERSLTRTSNAVPNLEAAIALVTIDAAYALGHDDVTGSITVGKFADYVVLDTNIFETDVDRISRTKVLATFLGGNATFASTCFGN
ncbi:MAG: amidohydrolase [Actinobacteria bacterium]|nr:amidohydrolase [Actinomycetota bacterium]